MVVTLRFPSSAQQVPLRAGRLPPLAEAFPLFAGRLPLLAARFPLLAEGLPLLAAMFPRRTERIARGDTARRLDYGARVAAVARRLEGPDP